CLPEDVEISGLETICPECAKKYAEDEPLAMLDRARLVELPLNARLEDVIGGADERAIIRERYALRKGILAQADRNLLYVDEVNLLNDEVIDAILDAAAQGHYVVRRGPVSATFRSRFALIGSMNPEEGRLRPQIMDRFGLRVIVRGLPNPTERLKAYQHVHAYTSNPRRMAAQFAEVTAVTQQEIQIARDVLPQVELPAEVAEMGLSLVEKLQIDSLRAEITLFEAARAHAIADGRLEVERQDLKIVAPIALRLRGL
ncbi:ATP-binding protein, partial [Chloroflexota bacterium]